MHSVMHIYSMLRILRLYGASLVAQIVKNLPAMPKTRIQSLGWEDPGKGNGKPLQYSCLENPIYRGAWQATVHGVAKSDTTVRLPLHLMGLSKGHGHKIS